LGTQLEDGTQISIQSWVIERKSTRRRSNFSNIQRGYCRTGKRRGERRKKIVRRSGCRIDLVEVKISVVTISKADKGSYSKEKKMGGLPGWV